MNAKRNQSQFGIHQDEVKQFDWGRAQSRIAQDMRSDFIFAPHLASVFGHAWDSLQDAMRAELQNGSFAPNQPITIEVPKSSRVRVSKSDRPGPSFSRPGSILYPKDRLLYQLLADAAAPIIKKATDGTRSFSHRLAAKDGPEMFVASRLCWSDMQKALARHAKEHNYVLKADVANCFSSINLHTLNNLLEESGYPLPLLRALENILMRFTTERSSRGIIQGVYPSDLFGNFYLTPIDQVFADISVPSVRYVDDIYVFMPTLKDSDLLLRRLTAGLRLYDLSLNEMKTYVLQSNALLAEEPDLEELFKSAVEEVREQLDDSEFRADYGFQTDWMDEEDDHEKEEALELKATESLFKSLSEFPLHQEKIERFCLPVFALGSSPIAIGHVLDNIEKMPAMTQLYCTYLGRFLDEGAVGERLEKVLLEDRVHFDWQKMWLLAALLNRNAAPDSLVKYCMEIVQSSSTHDALRAVAAIFVGKFGSYPRRRSLTAEYTNIGSPYVQTAILYAARFFITAERRNAVTKWSGHGDLHRLVGEAVSRS